jgi:hypothetical protein
VRVSLDGELVFGKETEWQQLIVDELWLVRGDWTIGRRLL